MQVNMKGAFGLLVTVIFIVTTSALSEPLGLDPCWFPREFLFGTASSAYQYEGAYNIDGRGQSIWDTYTHEHPDRIADRSTGNIALDHYHRFREDIALMKEIGMDVYRFSISWSRILPSGRMSGVVNQKGLTYYNNIINEVIAQGMKPFVTIFHWDLPQHLEFEYGGFRSKRIVQDFQDYAELLFDTFGDRVKHWITFNEPSIFSVHGYDLGTKAPGRCSNYMGNCTYGDSGTEPYMVAHHQLLAHAAAVDVYRRKYAWQKGMIGITLECTWMVPYSNTDGDLAAQQRSLDFKLGWFMDPITHGSYPKTMEKYVGKRLPRFTDDEKNKVKGSIDFLGLNYYTANYAQEDTEEHRQPSYTHDSRVLESNTRNGIPIGEQTGAEWIFIYPKGFRDLLVYIKQHYGDPIIYVTENGMADKNDPSLPIEEALKDTQRKGYYYNHLHYLIKAINEDDVKVRGYMTWSFMDNLEWDSGYTLRFGTVYVDFENNLQRYMKDSAIWFKEFLKPHSCPRRVHIPMDLKEL